MKTVQSAPFLPTHLGSNRAGFFVLGKGPRPYSGPAVTEHRAHQVLVLSARSEAALDGVTTRLAAHLEAHSELDLADVAYKLQVGRRSFRHRRAIVVGADDLPAAAAALRRPEQFAPTASAGSHPVVFMFPGQGSQYPAMAAGLYESEPVVRWVVDHCARILKPDLGLDIRRILFPGKSRRKEAAEALLDTRWAQPALFTVGYAVAQLWRSWGIQPAAMIGHSVGEYVAAALSEVMAIEDALRLIARRGALISALPRGSMLGVMASAERLERFLDDEVSLAAINAPGYAVLSGTNQAIDRVETALVRESVASRRLHTSHAFHSAMMQPILAEFEDIVASAQLSKPSIPFVATLTGQWADESVMEPRYWSAQLRSTVRFADGLLSLTKGDGRRGKDSIFLEVGPGRTLVTFAATTARSLGRSPLCLTSLPGPADSRSDTQVMLDGLGQMWTNGVEVDWARFHSGIRVSGSACRLTRSSARATGSIRFRGGQLPEEPRRFDLVQPTGLAEGVVPAKTSLEAGSAPSGGAHCASTRAEVEHILASRDVAKDTLLIPETRDGEESRHAMKRQGTMQAHEHMSRRVVITGVGAINSIGAGSAEFWSNLLAGVSGAGPIGFQHNVSLRQNVGCEVRRPFPAESLSGIGRATQLALAAADDAIRDSGLSASDLELADVSIGTTMGEPSMIENGKSDACIQANAISSGVARHFQSNGHNITWQTACAAGNYAVNSGWRRIASGRASIVLAGGSDAFSRAAFIGFARVGALSSDVCRPFDHNREGLLLGEGSGMLILEDFEHAKRRSAKIYAEILGCGFSCDAFHITQPHPKADGGVIAMGRGLKQAKIAPDNVDYVSAHGTGTKFNDLSETIAVKRVFGGRRVPISSIKALIGHSLGAASALEAVACCLAIRDRVIPPTWNYQEPDPNCDLDIVPNCPREADLKIVISNSYAFGGNNSCLVLGKYE